VHNVVGGTISGARNIISGNGAAGIDISNNALGTIVQGNFVGLNAAGTAAVPNTGNGIQVTLGAGVVTIGGTTAAARNVISGNLKSGIAIGASLACVIQGNFIGSDATGTVPIGNALHGIVVFGGTANTQIGGTAPGAGNTIAFNGGAGVLIGQDPGNGYTGDA